MSDIMRKGRGSGEGRRGVGAEGEGGGEWVKNNEELHL